MVVIGKKPGMPLSNPVKAFQRIVRRAGIFDKEVCIHTCRHSVAALIVSYGGTLYDVRLNWGTAAVSLHNGMRIFILSAYRTPVSYWRKG